MKSFASNNTITNQLFLILTLFFMAGTGWAQSDELCFDDPDSVAAQRPLLGQFREYYTDAKLTTWNARNYSTVTGSLTSDPAVQGVKLTLRVNAANEFIDRRVGGVTNANVLKGLNYAYKIAQNSVPEGSVMLPTVDPVVKVIDQGRNTKPEATANARNGVGWAWNSLLYTYEGIVYETVYLYHGALSTTLGDGELILVADKSAPICKAKLPSPVADPAGSQFPFQLLVGLSNIVPDADIYYRLGNDSFGKYDGSKITVSEDEVINAFVVKSGWQNSDTIAEVYTKIANNSTLQVTKVTGEPLGGTSNLTEADNSFVVKLSTPYATQTSVSIAIVSKNGMDQETVTITNPQTQNNALVFTDTVSFAVAVAMAGNAVVESEIYDEVTVSWVNPINAQDNPSTGFFVKPEPQVAKIYFADASWNELTGALSGTETMLYVVVEDAVFDPTRLQDYVITLSNKKGENNQSPADKEVYLLTEIVPGKYGFSIPVVESPPVSIGNGNFEIRIGDELKASYSNPINPSEKTDIIGYGVPNQMPGQVVFTNQNWSAPPELMTGNLWDADKGMVYVLYTDDYVASITAKNARLTIVSTNAQGVTITDRETVSLSFLEKQGELGVWAAGMVLNDSRDVVSGDGKLQFYFQAKITVEVAVHLNGTSERFDGDTARAVLTTARANSEEKVNMTDAVTGGVPGRTTEQLQVCVQEQVFSNTAVDTIVLDKIECALSGDKLEKVLLVQTSATSSLYCGIVVKKEAISGVLLDDILHCQDIDNVVSHYIDPVYGTGATGQVAIMDQTNSKIEFLNLSGVPVTSFSESEAGQFKVRLTQKSPDLYVIDTLIVKLTSNTGDTLDVLVYESAEKSGVFEGVVNVGFSAVPNMRNNVLEGKLNLTSLTNRMTVTASKGNAKGSLIVFSTYVPAERAWIVDGNGDGQADSIYIRFKGSLAALPHEVTSIDWPGEGVSGYTASTNTLMPTLSDINYVNGDYSLIAIVLPGVLDGRLELFPQGGTSLEVVNFPALTLPDGKVFQGQDVLIEDGIGAVVMEVIKYPSDNTYYKDVDGYLQKQPDTLQITLSEKIRPRTGAGVPWDSLFLFMPPGMNKADAYPLISQAGIQPKVQGPDSLVWTFIVDNSVNTMKPLIDDELFLNPLAPYVDASPGENGPESLERVVVGADNLNPINNSNIFVPVIGTSVGDPRSLSANLYIDESGQVAPGRDVVMVQNESGEYGYSRMWMKPHGLNDDGTVNSPDGECVSGAAESSGQEEYPENCLSAVQIFSTDTYAAEIAIFDHMGKFIHQSVQYFGRCGELENPERRKSKGLQSWLVWNQKDVQGNYVGTGVYLWKVKFTTSAGSHTAVYRQGVVRAGGDPEENCAH
ncbi:MAG: hypothetical protein HQK83_19630 [Fibrobacteria bacterium]|nr:hypothetical protein [Fibrobacteria bacterium]